MSNCNYCRKNTGREQRKDRKNTYCTKFCYHNFLKQDAKKNRTFRVKQIFKNKTKKLENGCIVWTACLTPNGYGQLTVNKKRWIASRLIYELYIGKIPRGKLVLHRCDNPPCVNLEHLFIGTYKDNVQDMLAKGRTNYNNTHSIGELNNFAKISEKEAIHIKQLLSNGYLASQISNKLNIGLRIIKEIKAQRTWKHLDTDGAKPR